LTHALLQNSPAINAGNPNFNPYSFNPPLLYDQRGPGFPRVVGGRLDIGVFRITTALRFQMGKYLPRQKPASETRRKLANSDRGTEPTALPSNLMGCGICWSSATGSISRPESPMKSTDSSA